MTRLTSPTQTRSMTCCELPIFSWVPSTMSSLGSEALALAVSAAADAASGTVPCITTPLSLVFILTSPAPGSADAACCAPTAAGWCTITS